jgi:hypothetical protein
MTSTFPLSVALVTRVFRALGLWVVLRVACTVGIVVAAVILRAYY